MGRGIPIRPKVSEHVQEVFQGVVTFENWPGVLCYYSCSSFLQEKVKLHFTTCPAARKGHVAE